MFTNLAKSGIMVMLIKNKGEIMMNMMKKTIITLIVILLSLVILCGTVQAASVSIRPSSNKVTVRK